MTDIFPMLFMDQKALRELVDGVDPSGPNLAKFVIIFGQDK
jgi:hypothetical protein